MEHGSNRGVEGESMSEHSGEQSGSCSVNKRSRVGRGSGKCKGVRA